MAAVLKQRTAAISLIFHTPYLRSYTLGSVFYGISGRGDGATISVGGRSITYFPFLVLLVSLYLSFWERMEQLGGALACGCRYGKEEC